MTILPLLALLASTSTAQPAPAKAPAPAQAPVAAPAAAPAGGAGEAAPAQIAESVDVIERLNEQVPLDLRFTDGFQNSVSLRETLQAGKPVLLTMVYFECPMLCSLVLQGVTRSLNESGLDLGKDYTAVTVSFNPKDSPRETAMYQAGYLAKLNSAKKAKTQDWLFLTGTEQNIKKLAETVGFKYRWDAPTQQFEHPAVSFVLTPDGRISRYLYGVQIPARDMRLSLVEASGGKVGTSFDRVLLKCFKYDPASRRYHLYVYGFVRAGAFLAFAGLATMLVVLWRREAKKGTVA